MSRIAPYFTQLQQAGRCALIPYVTAGDPNPGETVELMHTLVSAGADILELGVPFSDPMADGPVIQAACERALQHDTSLNDVLEMVATFRQTNAATPVVLMGYLNPIERMGYEPFVAKASAVGVDAVLTVDMPPEESEQFIKPLNAAGMDAIYLLSPTTTDQRIQMIAAAGSGFLYYVSLKGVTGAANLDVAAVEKKLAQIKRFTDLPLGVGFGIHDAASAANVARLADAVVVGSALIRIIESHSDDMNIAKEKITSLLASMREAIDAARSVPVRQTG